MTIRTYITHISVVTHDCGDKPWFKGPGYYGCIIDGDHIEWHGPYVDTQEAKQQFSARAPVHSPALGARGRS